MNDKSGNLYLNKIPANKTQLWELVLELKKSGLFEEKTLTESMEDKIRISKVYKPNFEYFGPNKVIRA